MSNIGSPSSSEHASSSTDANSAAAFSISRLLKTVVPIVVAMLAGAWAAQAYLPSVAQRNFERNQFGNLLGHESTEPKSTIEFTDQDGDLLADSPPAGECIAPDKLVFSYVASEDAGDAAATWQSWLESLSQTTGLLTEYVHFTSVDDQLAAMAEGKLHITAVNTGAVPVAVKAAGFVPVSTFGKDGEFGYTMDILVQADSPIKDIQGLRDHKITFVRPSSNSGFKAALVYLMSEHQMLPERDYAYGFSMGHDSSVHELIAGKTDAVPVASDLFDRMVANGEVDAAKVRVLYESERFPPVALGYAFNLTPALREAIAKQLTQFDWANTPLGQAYGASGANEFVAVHYKNNWANIRRIDDALDEARAAN